MLFKNNFLIKVINLHHNLFMNYLIFNTMKKGLFFVCAAALCLAIASCGNNSSKQQEEVVAPAETTTAVDSTATTTDTTKCAETECGGCADSTCVK